VSKEGIEEYDKYFRVYRDEADKEAKEKANNKAVLDINVWFKKINEKYPIDDDLDKKTLITHLKARLIALFYYKIATFRDDLKELLIIRNDSENVSSSTNYIVVPEDAKKNAKFILNEDKTSNKNKSVSYDIDKEITNKIREFMKLQGISYNNYLFGKSSLSSFVNKMNKGIVKGSITQIRKMKVSTQYKEAQGDTIKEDEIATKARHTSRTAKHTYLHNPVLEKIPERTKTRNGILKRIKFTVF
jgi:hypothetical protein